MAMKVQGTRSIGSISVSLLLFASIYVIIFNSSHAEAAEQAPDIPAAGNMGSDEVLTASGSNRFAVWSDSTPGNDEILFRRSTDNGATWKAVSNLSDNTGASDNQRLAVSGDSVYSVWHDLTPGNHDHK